MRCRIVPNARTLGLLVLALPDLTHPPEFCAEADDLPLDDLLPFLRYVTWPASAFPIAVSHLFDPLLHGARFDVLLNRPILPDSGLRLESPMGVSARRTVKSNGAG